MNEGKCGHNRGVFGDKS